MKLEKALKILILASSIPMVPAMGGTILEFRGTASGTNGDYFLSGGTSAFSGSGAPVAGTAQGNYKDVIWKGGDTANVTIEQSNGNYYAESLSITNGKVYTLQASSTASSPSIRFGATGTGGNATEVIVPFWNANVPNYTGSGTTSPGYLDLLYIAGNSTLKINSTSVNIGGFGAGNSGTANAGPFTVSIRQSGNFNIASGSSLISEAAITGSSKAITFTGGGNTTLNGNNTYTGATMITSGKVEIGSSGALASSVMVQNGSKFVYNSSTTYAKTLTLNGLNTSNRAVFSGNATVGTSVALDSVGDTLSPGNSPGTMTFGTTQTWDAFSYDWELNNFTGTTAGTNFDKIAITGGLTLNASSGSYILNILSLTSGNISGAVSNFSEINQAWTILSTTTGISNFDATKWTLNSAGFSTSTTPTGSFALSQSGNDLVLAYTAVPETSTLAITLSAAAMLISRRRRMAR